MTPLEQWYADHPDGRDRPSITVWMPSELPTANLQTSSVYTDGKYDGERLDDPNRPIVNLYLAGINFGGPLSELEGFLAAATAALAITRAQANRLAADQVF